MYIHRFGFLSSMLIMLTKTSSNGVSLKTSFVCLKFLAPWQLERNICQGFFEFSQTLKTRSGRLIVRSRNWRLIFSFNFTKLPLYYRNLRGYYLNAQYSFHQVRKQLTTDTRLRLLFCLSFPLPPRPRPRCCRRAFACGPRATVWAPAEQECPIPE